MHHLLKSHHPVRHAKSFQYAFEGVFHALLNEPNFRVELVISLFFVSIGIILHINLTHWAILILAIGFLLCAEIINTVIEELMDMLVNEYHSAVKVIKDMAAAFVLTASLTSLIVFIVIIWDYIKL